ncbi:Flap-structured DNA-binding and RNA-binding protein [Pyricularia oryzae]|nr:Flap-structured DNA-binding and RNA-binding protein [Pyricularia oryzae]
MSAAQSTATNRMSTPEASNTHAASNRMSTPEASNVSSLRPPSSRAVGSGSHLRASADVAALTGSAARGGNARPSSDFYHAQGNSEIDPQDKLAQQWIADIDQYETTLEEMAAATLDQDFKDELSAIEQWFRVLSEAERTAALYALLQQTTQVQIRFFIQVLQQMGKNHPMSGVLSPANFDKDPMSNRLSDAMNKLSVDSARNSIARGPASQGAKRQSGLDPSTINMMFPDAAAAIATEKAKFTQQTGNQPPSNRNSTAVDNRNSLVGASEGNDANGQHPTSPWGTGDAAARAKPAPGQAPMGQFAAPSIGAGLRSPRPGQLGGNAQIQNTTLTASDKPGGELGVASPFGGPSGGNWASMVNTPMAANFPQQQGGQADMLANATAMKLAAMSTVNNRFALDDVRKYRRTRSNDNSGQNPLSPGMISPNVVMVDEHGRVLSRDQLLNMQGMQSQQQMSFNNRSRPNSPGIALQQAAGFGGMAFASPQSNNFMLGNALNPMSGGLAPVGMGQFGMGGLAPEGYLSDHSDMNRGRSPRGRRGSSKPPEDPTDPTLLQDIPAWLRSLRLHKYTDNLKDMRWVDLIELDDKQLEERGVNALGARRKMLKVFEQVKEAKTEGRLST